MGMKCRLMSMVRRMVGAQVYSVVRWLFDCGLVVGGFDCAIVVSLLAMPSLCCFLRVTQEILYQTLTNPRRRTTGMLAFV